MGTIMPAVDIRGNYHQVLERIEAAARRTGRDPAGVRLVVVTKGQPLDAVREVITAGARDLGENYVAEGVAKIQATASETGDPLTWHMIGHVQSRKAHQVTEYYDWLHSLDSLKLALRLDRFAAEAGRRLPVLLECNVSGEETKFGWPAWEEESWPDLLTEIAQVASLPNLEVRGLMAMAPYSPDPEAARPAFRRLRSLRDFLSGKIHHARWEELSMGMSGDFETAIQEGATLVRIGTAILGPRPVA